MPMMSSGPSRSSAGCWLISRRVGPNVWLKSSTGRSPSNSERLGAIAAVERVGDVERLAAGHADVKEDDRLAVVRGRRDAERMRRSPGSGASALVPVSRNALTSKPSSGPVPPSGLPFWRGAEDRIDLGLIERGRSDAADVVSRAEKDAPLERFGNHAAGLARRRLRRRLSFGRECGPLNWSILELLAFSPPDESLWSAPAWRVAEGRSDGVLGLSAGLPAWCGGVEDADSRPPPALLYRPGVTS